MYDFMEYCLRCYYRTSGWNEDNQYSNLCSWSRSLLDFYTPQGLALHLAKLPTRQFKPSYTMAALPYLNGSISYLFTSRPLDVGTSATVDFQDMVDHFTLARPAANWGPHASDYLVYGRMFFPGAALEAMFVRRVSSRLQYLITAVNHPKSSGLPQMAFQMQYDAAKWCTEWSYTTDDGLLGLRGLYNFGKEGHGQWSTGMEVYYGLLDKSGGLSTGLRYQTHPASSAPLSITYTVNPIVGHMSTSYVAQVADNLVLGSRFDFSIYSYDSDLAVGFEWRTKNAAAENDTQKLEGLMKGKLGFASGLALMWEGRYKNTLFSLGLTADLSNPANPVRTMGFEVQFFS
ncbi:hypothetical protein BC940DRAFT_292058 [Gongronella butleri]|nr:hypothetical protein BC940DRAFT_292058 [Gongronella butleri]